MIRWTKDLETGIPFVDGDHRILVRLLNQVDESIAAFEESTTLGSVLGALRDYTVYHFGREETMLRASGYAGLDDHRDEHALLSGQVVAMVRRFRGDPASVEKAEVRNFLRNWLIENILVHDFAYREACLASPEAAARAEAIGFANSLGVGGSLSSLHVLVVDDNERFRLLLATVLKALGIREVSLAAGPEEGLERWRKRPGDVVICDWLMPGMPARAFAAAVRARSPDARIVALSALESGMVESQAGTGMLDAILEKPIAARDLARALVAH